MYMRYMNRLMGRNNLTVLQFHVRVQDVAACASEKLPAGHTANHTEHVVITRNLQCKGATYTN